MLLIDSVLSVVKDAHSRFQELTIDLDYVFIAYFQWSSVLKVSGGDAGGVTPVPIPNTAVKPSRADDTAPERVWESRMSPEFQKPPRRKARGLFLFQDRWARRRLTIS